MMDPSFFFQLKNRKPCTIIVFHDSAAFKGSEFKFTERAQNVSNKVVSMVSVFDESSRILLSGMLTAMVLVQWFSV